MDKRNLCCSTAKMAVLQFDSNHWITIQQLENKLPFPAGVARGWWTVYLVAMTIS